MSVSLTFYNTLTRTKAAFAPIDPAHVRLYACGPTVYDYAHIGNGRAAIVFDLLFRLLRQVYGEDHVVYARNVTDVDDKINARAARDFPTLPLNQAIAQVTAVTLAQYREDVAALGCLQPTHEPRATDHMGEMRALIERLVQRGIAYIAEDHVLFSPAAMEARGLRYGALARRSPDEMLAGARVEVAPYKRDAMDFVLWKPSKPGEPSWESPAGIAAPGRPGWHIECSAMSMKTLLEPYGGGLACEDADKQTFDIHGGGVDLVFPHHENEIAQSCCALGGSRMANVWMHNGFLQVEGEKMSKSLGNFVTIRDLIGKFPGDAIRLNMLKTHYRQPLDWTLNSLLETLNEIRDWTELLIDRLGDEFVSRGYSGTIDAEVIEALADDLNAPLAIARLREMFKEVKRNADISSDFARTLAFLGIKNLDKPGFFDAGFNAHFFESGPSADEKVESLALQYRAAVANGWNSVATTRSSELETYDFLTAISPTGHLTLRNRTSAEVEDKIENLVSLRSKAREKKDWNESDRLRDQLSELGVTLKDSKDGTSWELKR
jgi:cysteinyl-tRNA synthetase